MLFEDLRTFLVVFSSSSTLSANEGRDYTLSTVSMVVQRSIMKSLDSAARPVVVRLFRCRQYPHNGS